MGDRERDILERAVAAVAEQAAKADALVDELQAAGLPADGPVLQAKLIRLELLKVKGDLERELGRWVLDCRRCHRKTRLGLFGGYSLSVETVSSVVSAQRGQGSLLRERRKRWAERRTGPRARFVRSRARSRGQRAR
jgi:hypothetical protein